MISDIKYLQGLNENQLEAVKTTEGYVRIIAGAGSGKTKTLVSRYAYLVNELGLNTANILCVTFTNKAAQEMKRRIQQIVTAGNVGDYICTYHGFCVKILREDISKLFYPKSFSIIDEDDKKSILKDIYEELGLTIADFTYKEILRDISLFKDLSPIPLGVCPPNYIEEYIDVIADENKYTFEKFSDNKKWLCFIKYLQKQLKGFYIDFDDIILFALYVLHHNQDVLLKWQQRLDYIMIDETQDNNSHQWELLYLLQGYCRNLLIVGDPDQCIYGWRGAILEGFLNFDKKYTPCKNIILNQNYRSTPNILDIANSIIINNSNRIEKDLYSHREELFSVTHFHAKSDFEEGEYVANTIIEHIQNGAKLSDFSILYRASYQSRIIEQALIKYKLAYVVYGGMRFFERREIKDVLSYLRMVDGPDDLSFRRTINLPSRKLGKTFIEELTKLAEKENLSLYETLGSNINVPKLNKDGAKEYISIIEEARRVASSMTISDLTKYLLDKTKLTEIYRKEGDEDRLDNIKELITSIQLYENDNVEEDDLSLNRYLQDIALYTNLDYKEERDNIKIMTIHQSKGMEFPIVFVIGMSEGIFPNHRSIKERKNEGLEEERRLAYVAITRAENQLYLTESEGFNMQIKSEKFPSRFIFEIEKKKLICQGILTKEMEYNAKLYINECDGYLLANRTALEKGQEIVHTIFGEGKIIEVEEVNDSLTVKFDKMDNPRHFLISRILDFLKK